MKILIASLVLSFAVAQFEIAPARGQTPPSSLPRLNTGTTTALRYRTIEDYVRDEGRWPMKRSEAEEIVAALKLSVAAHYTALSFYEQAVKLFGKTATEQDRVQMEKNLLACAQSSLKTMALLEIWERRAAALRD
ncbi:hypothetical protein [Horticoccus sp. 23ND18S-11]|uniref:hypothetical protein n=1 Tax=Horticoccus sp. 23ND18S-11 TaxID=3391832 RepID=UPI0039C9E03F